MSSAFTIVINAAGIGSRLGMNKPKCLIEINDLPIIEHQLRALSNYHELVIVVGYQAREVINKVKSLRDNVTIAFNHRYLENGTAASLKIGARFGKNQIISVDGDILFSLVDFERFAKSSSSCIGIMGVKTDEPVFVELSNDKLVLGLSQQKKTDHEWTGLLKMTKEKIMQFGNGHVFPNIVENLPINQIPVDCMEIDYPDDIRKMQKWLNSQKGKSFDN